MDEAWMRFEVTGRVTDYLSFKYGGEDSLSGTSEEQPKQKESGTYDGCAGSMTYAGSGNAR